MVVMCFYVLVLPQIPFVGVGVLGVSFFLWLILYLSSKRLLFFHRFFLRVFRTFSFLCFLVVVVVLVDFFIWCVFALLFE